jgi:uncharacterized protein (UPF0297 family)
LHGVSKRKKLKKEIRRLKQQEVAEELIAYLLLI